MAATSSSAKSMLAYYGPRAGLEGLKLDMPVTPEEVRVLGSKTLVQRNAQKLIQLLPCALLQLEFFAEQEFVDIVPNFSLAQGNRLLLMAVSTLEFHKTGFVF